MNPSFDPIAIALAVVRVFDECGIAYTVGGSLASSFAGEPRSTVDIDIVADIAPSHVSKLVERLSGDFYIDEHSLLRAVLARSTTNLIHQPSQIKVDLFVAGGTPLDAQQLARRQAIDLGGGRILYVHPPEDILLQKLRWYRRGGEVSDRQWRDVLAIVRVQGLRLDRDYLQTHAQTLGVADLLTRALIEGGEP